LSKPGRKWLRGCSLGCGIVLVLLIIGTGVGTLMLMSPFKQAIETREKLDEALGDAVDYQPAPDGAIPAERMEAFLRIRGTAMEHCEPLTAQMNRLEQMDELGEDPGAGEIAHSMFDAMKAVAGIGPMTGEFFLARNEALLREQMGVQEYTYLFVMAYGSRLYVREQRGEVTSIRILTTSRVRADLRGMLQAQLDAERSVEPSPAGRSLMRLLENEIDTLEADHHRIPWQDGLPEPIDSSVAPYREALDQLFCAGILEFELTRNRKFLVGVQSD